MAHADVSFHILDLIADEDLVHKTHALFRIHIPKGAFGVGHCDTAALLSPVLEGEKPVVDGGRHIIS